MFLSSFDTVLAQCERAVQQYGCQHAPYLEVLMSESTREYIVRTTVVFSAGLITPRQDAFIIVAKDNSDQTEKKDTSSRETLMAPQKLE